jgi:uncharacterized protein (TIGR00255 family)
VTIQSMTGFARSSGAHDGSTWTWELRSVNGRSLEVRSRLSGYDSLEAAVRSTVARRLRRGNVNVALQIARDPAEAQVRVNEAVLQAVLEQLAKLRALDVEAAAPTLDGILALKGVLETVEAPESEARRGEREAALLRDLETALAALVANRRQEGAQLAVAIGRHVDEIARLAAEAETLAAAQPDALRDRLQAQLDALLGASPPVPQERLAQELALLATKADVREELDRLRAHVCAAREMLAKGGAIGRQLDFLSQEFNREANTLCSKSADVALTRVGLALKGAIDQLREQVQNVE